MHDVSTAKPQNTPESAQHVRKSELDAGTPSLEQPLSAGLLLRLQRTVGNSAVNDLLRRRGLVGKSPSGNGHAGTAPVQRLGNGSASTAIVQRHADGEALPAEADLVSEIESKEAQDGGGDATAEGAASDAQGSTQDDDSRTAEGGGQGGDIQDATQAGGDTQVPEETRSATQETADKKDATDAGTAFKALTPAAMSLAAAQKVLTGAYGGVHTMVPGSIVILADQPACSAKYDEVCIAEHFKRPNGDDWKAGDKAKDDVAAGVTVEGFAWKGIVYVNGKTTLVTATAHEMLHINTASDYSDTMGRAFNEGSTEYLARKAVAAAGITVPAVTAYPMEITITQALIDLVGEDMLISSYFGGAEALTDAVKTTAKGTWDEVRAAAEGLQVDTAKSLLEEPGVGAGSMSDATP